MTTNYRFNTSDNTIHKFAAAHLLSNYDSELILTQGNFAYLVKGGKDGHLYYKKGNSDNWVLIANWCLYGLYIVVRYKKAVWLRSMYNSLFTKMSFRTITFNDHSIELLSSDEQTLRSRRFRLSPPAAFNRVVSEQFGFFEGKTQLLKKEMELD